jgi:hypothetical protein
VQPATDAMPPGRSAVLTDCSTVGSVDQLYGHALKEEEGASVVPDGQDVEAPIGAACFADRSEGR